MDPFSISVGVAGLVGLAATTLSVANDYLSGVKHAKESIITLVTELEVLQLNLKSLDTFLRGSTVRERSMTFEPTSVLRSCTLSCEDKLKSLSKKLGKLNDSRTSRLLWPLSEKDNQKTLQELRAFSQWIQFALTIDGCSLLSRTSDDVLKIMGQQLKWFESIHSLEDQTAQLQIAVAKQTQILEDGASAKRRHKILNWLSKLDHEQKHHAVRSQRVQDTGKWLLKRIEYLVWRDGAYGLNVLWCHGMQGSGKTILTSMVIDELKSTISSPESPVAFFYFDYRDQGRQTPSNLLLSFLKQITAVLPDIPKSVIDGHEKSPSNADSLSLRDLEGILHEIASGLRRVYLIIDALDECDESTHRKATIQLLARIQQIPNIYLFITSRQYPHDIQESLQSHPQIAIQAHESDLRRYMYGEIENSNVTEIDHEFASTIVETLISRAHGMFLLPVLQLRTVLKEPTAGEMEDALEALSRNLPEAFEETINRIQRLPESRRQLGMNALMWICHAKCPLTVFELSEALSVRVGQADISRKRCPSANMILECCQGLVILDPESMSIRLAHYAIQEYLMDQSEKLFPRVDSIMATTCLLYLMFDSFCKGPFTERFEMELRIQSYPLFSYASWYWGAHVRSSETDSSIQQLLLKFFASPEALAGSYQITEFEKGRRREYWIPEECYSVSPLHHACYFGLESTVRDLLDRGTYEINARTKMGTTPIIKAACASPSGHPSIVKLLLERGADPYLGNWYGNALHCAAEAGCSATIRQLVAHGMKLEAHDEFHRLPIHCTLDNDHAEAFETLIELGAVMGVDLFFVSISDRCFEIVDLILRKGWVDVNETSVDGVSAMHIAAHAGDLAILSRLLEAGANINQIDDEGETPFDYVDVDEERSGDVGRFLTDHGAVAGKKEDVNQC